jgi:creatinine amidohydrolase
MSDKKHVSRRHFLETAGLAAAVGCAAPAALAADPPAVKRRSRKYEEMRPEQFYEEFDKTPIAYWSTAPMEEHGLHNPLGTDFYQGYEVCLRAAEISGGIVFPPVPIGPAGHPSWSRSELRSGKHKLMPPSFWTSRELCKQLYTEIFEYMAELKFKVCIAFAGHWPCDFLLQEIQKELDGRVGAMRFWGGGMCRIVPDIMNDAAKKYPLCTGHGMMFETSLMLATHPDLVDLPRAKRIKDHPLDSQLKTEPQNRIDRIATANAEVGKLQLNTAAQRAAKLATGMLASTGKP